MAESEHWVSMESTAVAEEVSRVRELFDEIGLGIEVRPDFYRKGVGDLPWIIMIGVPAIRFLTAFAGSFGKSLGKGIGEAFSTWINRLHEVRNGDRGSVILRDEERHVEIILPPELPADAHDQLIKVLEHWPQGVPGEANQLNYRSETGWVRPW